MDLLSRWREIVMIATRIPALIRSSMSRALFTVLLVDAIACTQPGDLEPPPENIPRAPADPRPRSEPIARATVSTRSPFTLFESGQVRPLALSPSGKLLFAVNTPDNRLEVFKVGSSGLVHRASVPVGLEPVAVAAPSDDEAWVVNHLSDSVSVVRVSDDGRGGVVVRTLLVGDEPRDVVFAGPGKTRAFITTAHRGQNAPFDPQLTTPGVDRADVWVFD